MHHMNMHFRATITKQIRNKFETKIGQSRTNHRILFFIYFRLIQDMLTYIKTYQDNIRQNTTKSSV